MEPTTGVEPVNLFLTKEALYRLSYVGGLYEPVFVLSESKDGLSGLQPPIGVLERETRFELATSSLEG
jgi:hypothetical protein